MSSKFAQAVKACIEKERFMVREVSEIVGIPNQTARQYVQSMLSAGLVSVESRAVRPRYYNWIGG